jgi:hypothetical protein
MKTLVTRYHQVLLFDPTAKFNGPFRFLDLPEEFRVMVYNEVWPTTANLELQMREEDSRQLELRVCYDTTDAPPGIPEGKGFGIYCYKKLPDWVLVNKFILKDAMAQLYRRSSFFGEVPGSWLTTNFRFGRPESASGFRQDVDESLEELVEDEKPPPEHIPEQDYLRTAVQVITTWRTDLHLLKKMEPCAR